MKNYIGNRDRFPHIPRFLQFSIHILPRNLFIFLWTRSSKSFMIILILSVAKIDKTSPIFDSWRSLNNNNNVNYCTIPTWYPRPCNWCGVLLGTNHLNHYFYHLLNLIFKCLCCRIKLFHEINHCTKTFSSSTLWLDINILFRIVRRIRWLMDTALTPSKVKIYFIIIWEILYLLKWLAQTIYLIDSL